MTSALLLCALALPPAIPYHYITPYWDWSANETKVIHLLRDWPNGHTASRPRSWVLIYGRHPLWAMKLRESGVKVVMLFHERLKWPLGVQGSAFKTPFPAKMFQVYLYDWFPIEPVKLVQEASRIVDDFGFFLYRFTGNGTMAEALKQFGWERFSLDFHEFTIWWRPKNYTHIELTHSIILRSA